MDISSIYSAFGLARRVVVVLAATDFAVPVFRAVVLVVLLADLPFLLDTTPPTVTLTTCYLPARRVLRIEPAHLLRGE